MIESSHLSPQVPDFTKEPKPFVSDDFIRESQVKLFPRSKYTNEDIVKHYIQQLEEGDSDSFYIADLTKVYDQYVQWKTYLPRIQPFYAVKCCPDPLMVKTLYELGCSFDCASKSEIALVTDQNIPADRIVYANPVKDLQALKFAKSQGVDLMTFDNEEELNKIKTHYPNARLLIRIKADDSGSHYKLSLKFGCSVAYTKVLLAKALSLGLEVVGVSFHIGSKCDVTDSWAPSLRDAREVIQIGRDLGFNMHIVDIGGGFPGTDHDSKVSFQQMAEAINKSIDAFFHDVPDIKIIAEPGRYFCTSSYIVAFNVIGKKKVTTPEKGNPEFCYYVNEGIFNSFNYLVWEESNLNFKFFEKSKERRHKSILYGPTPNERDVLSREYELPDLEVGDWMYMEDFGAYTRGVTSEYCSFPLNKCKYIITY